MGLHTPNRMATQQEPVIPPPPWKANAAPPPPPWQAKPGAPPPPPWEAQPAPSSPPPFTGVEQTSQDLQHQPAASMGSFYSHMGADTVTILTGLAAGASTLALSPYIIKKSLTQNLNGVPWAKTPAGRLQIGLTDAVENAPADINARSY